MSLAGKLGLVLTALAALLPTCSGSFLRAQGQPPVGGPSPAELKALVDRVAVNPLRDDDALELYERIERRIVRSGTPQQKPTEDKTWRVIPSGTAHVRVQLEESGKSVDASLIRKQLEGVAQGLPNSTDPIFRGKNRTKPNSPAQEGAGGPSRSRQDRFYFQRSWAGNSAMAAFWGGCCGSPIPLTRRPRARLPFSLLPAASLGWTSLLNRLSASKLKSSRTSLSAAGSWARFIAAGDLSWSSRKSRRPSGCRRIISTM